MSLKASARWMISCLVAFHLLAVVVPPLSFQARGSLGSSPSVETLLSIVRHYSELLYLDRGYAFFAPDPGPSHLIQAAITDDSGNMVEVMYPDLQQQWPRLLYHRHFMLAEFLNEIYSPPGPPPALVKENPVQAAQWRQARARYEHVRQSIVDSLQHQNEGKSVAIRRIEHLLPSFIELANDPIELTDSRLYVVLPDRPIDAPPNLGLPEALPDGIPSAPTVPQEQLP